MKVAKPCAVSKRSVSALFPQKTKPCSIWKKHRHSGNIGNRCIRAETISGTERLASHTTVISHSIVRYRQKMALALPSGCRTNRVRDGQGEQKYHACRRLGIRCHGKSSRKNIQRTEKSQLFNQRPVRAGYSYCRQAGGSHPSSFRARHHGMRQLTARLSGSRVSWKAAGAPANPSPARRH